jgi:ribosomal protein L11 methylase PrmA
MSTPAPTPLETARKAASEAHAQLVDVAMRVRALSDSELRLYNEFKKLSEKHIKAGSEVDKNRNVSEKAYREAVRRRSALDEARTKVRAELDQTRATIIKTKSESEKKWKISDEADYNLYYMENRRVPGRFIR